MGLDCLAGLKETDFESIRQMVYAQTGIKLTLQKKVMIESRLMKRLRMIRCPSFSQYVKIVKLDPKERSVMFNLLTTNVTKFFREEHHFQFLRDTLLPELASNQSRNGPIKIWSAGCSTGQEPYSLGIVCSEFFAGYGSKYPGADFKIVATDINTDVIKKAEEGIYLFDEVGDIPYPLLKKYFKLGTGPNAGKFKIKDSIRQKITFKYLNLVSREEDYPVDGLYDIIFCRNVFIYFDRETKNRAVRKFYNKLRPGGYLFLGHSESLDVKNPGLGKWSFLQHTVYRKEP